MEARKMNLLDKTSPENNKIKRDAWLHNLRRNNVLTWAENLESVIQYADILNTCSISSTLEIESGIVKINPNGRYIGHQYVAHIKAGFSFLEMCVLLRSKIIEFEAEYGKIRLSGTDIYNLKQIVYIYNRDFMHVDVSDRKRCSHLEQSGEVLYYLLSKSITLDAQANGFCTLTFANSNNSKKDYCTIFTEEQVNLLQKVNNSIV